MRNYGGGGQFSTFLGHRRVPAASLNGEEGKGWQYIMRAFYASGTVEPIYAMQEARLRELLEYCKAIPGKLDDPHVKADLAELAGIVQTQRLLAYEIIGDNAHGRQTPWGGGVQQVAAKEYEPLFAQIYDRVLGPTSQLRSGSSYAPLNGKPEAWYRQSFANHAGGTSQLKRMVLATRGLGLPR